MIPVDVNFKDIRICNIEHSQLPSVLSCLNESDDSHLAMGRNDEFTYDDIEERYVETLISSLEFFCGVYVNGAFAGIIKGRLENKCKIKLWVLSFILMEAYRNKGIGTRIMDCFENYFKSSYSIDEFCVTVDQINKRGCEFWLSRNYSLLRVAKSINDNNTGTLIYGKKEG